MASRLSQPLLLPPLLPLPLPPLLPPLPPLLLLPPPRGCAEAFAMPCTLCACRWHPDKNMKRQKEAEDVFTAVHAACTPAVRVERSAAAALPPPTLCFFPSRDACRCKRRCC